jgi:hypothetical protein
MKTVALYKNGKHTIPNGSIEYSKNGFLHREDGPAYIMEGEYAAWFIDGLRHREDGPAIEYYDKGELWMWAYYYNGERINISTAKEFEQYKKLIAFQ